MGCVAGRQVGRGRWAVLQEAYAGCITEASITYFQVTWQNFESRDLRSEYPFAPPLLYSSELDSNGTDVHNSVKAWLPLTPPRC